MQNIIDLAGTYVAQNTSGHIKTEWKVNLNGTETTIQTFPSHFTENEIFAIMDFAKKYELEAFNKGVRFGNKNTVDAYEAKLDAKNNIINKLEMENERLAEALDAEQKKGL